MQRPRRPAERACGRRSHSVGVLCVAIVMAFAGTACSGNTPGCYGVNVGDRIGVSVLGVYEDGVYASTHPCGFSFDITQGLELIATDIANPDSQTGGATCNAAVVTVEPFGDWTWTPENSVEGTDPDILLGAFQATNGTCHGYVTIGVSWISGRADPFATYEAGQATSVVMQRTFQDEDDGDAGCPSICDEYYSVALSRL